MSVEDIQTPHRRTPQDPKSEQAAGHIKVKFETEQAAAMCVSSLNQRWFAGKQITASCIEESEMDDA